MASSTSPGCETNAVWVAAVKQLDTSATLMVMAISPKMLAILQKVDDAREHLFAGLRASAKRDAEAKARAKANARKRKPTVTNQE